MPQTPAAGGATPLLVVNRHAGSGRAAALEPALRRELASHWPAVRIVAATSAHDATAAIAALPPRQRIVAVGGDGTLHALLPALLAGDHELGLVPAGSGDDAARAFGLRGQPWRETLRHAIEAPTRAIDVGVAHSEHESRPFVSSLCAGFDAAVAQRAARGAGSAHGLPRYVAATLAEVLRLRRHRARVTVDGVPLLDDEVLLCAVLNTPTYGGGMPMQPAAAIDDGRLDVVLAGRFGRLGTLAMLPRLLRGRHLGDRRVRQATGTSLQIDSQDPLPLAADGEAMHAACGIAVTVHPRALRVATRR